MQSTWLVYFDTEKEIKAGRGEVTSPRSHVNQRWAPGASLLFFTQAASFPATVPRGSSLSPSAFLVSCPEGWLHQGRHLLISSDTAIASDWGVYKSVAMSGWLWPGDICD